MNLRMTTHLFVTDRLLIKGRVETGERRLTNLLNSPRPSWLTVREVDLLDGPRDQRALYECATLRTSEIVLAHEYVDLGGDATMRQLAGKSEERRRAVFYLTRPFGWRLEGEVRGDAQIGAKDADFVVVTRPRLATVDEEEGQRVDDFCGLSSLPYLVLHRSHVQLQAFDD